MKFFIFLLLVISINNVKSSTESLDSCKLNLYSVYTMSCDNFQGTYLPYSEDFKKATAVEIYGNFDALAIDPRYENLVTIRLRSKYLQRFAIANYTSFKKIERIDISRSDQVVYVDFTGSEEFEKLWYFTGTLNKMLNINCESLRSTNLREIRLTYCNFETFDFSCIPSTLRDLNLRNNKISSLNLLPSNSSNLNTSTNVDTPSYCPHMKKLTSLRHIDLHSNGLQDFRFSCLPPGIWSLDLSYNEITEMSDLASLPHDRPRDILYSILDIRYNPINCTCSLFRAFVRLVTKKVDINANNDAPLTCGNTDSQLADYPWSNKNVEAMKLYDASALDCLAVRKNTENVNNDADIGSGDDDGNSGSINFIDISLIIISHIIQFCFMLF